jgi:hypothetical protein
MPSPDRHFANAAIFTHSTGLTPNSGDAALYIKSDNKAYIKDSAGAEVIVGGTGTIAGTLGTVDNAVPRADGTGGVTAQGSDIVIDDATTSTANNVAITNQHAGQTNSSLVLSPKGTGALILGPKPNGAASGGNARGTYAVDLQNQRTAATQVASGSDSALVATIHCTVSGARAGAFAAASSSVTANASAVIAGNVASAGGILSLASGDNVSTTGTYSFAQSRGALADRLSMQAHASGSFAGSATGDAQRARFVLRNKTTTNAAVELFLDGSATRLTIPSGKYLTGTINIAGIKSDGTAAASYIRQFSIKNVAGTTSLVGTVNTIGTDEAASTSISITANDTNDALKVEVTGITSETWRWVAAVDVVEVAYGA